MTIPQTTGVDPLIQEKATAIQAAGRMARRALEGALQPEHLVFTLPPSRSHILWLTGHIALSLDRLSGLSIGAPLVLPEHYTPLFGLGSQPLPDAAAYPPLGELLEALNRAVEATVARVLTLAPADLARPLPDSLPVARIFPTLGELLTGAVIHTSYHSGQISLLRRVQGLPSGLGI